MLELDASHTYRLDGRVVPGVTDTIRPLAPDWERFVPEAARERGTLVHALCAVMDGRDDLWPDGLERERERELLPYCDAWARFKREADVTILPEMIEHRVYHPLYEYAGTIDRLVVWNDLRVVVDIKTGSYHPTHRLQLAAYREALNAECVQRIHHGACVYLRHDGTYTVRSFPRLTTAFTAFLALGTIEAWNLEHGQASEAPDLWVPLPDEEIFLL